MVIVTYIYSYYRNRKGVCLMIYKNYNFVRDNLKEKIDKVNKYDEIIKIKTDTHNAVLMSEKEYNATKETLYMKQSSHNAKRLEESIQNLERKHDEVD